MVKLLVNRPQQHLSDVADGLTVDRGDPSLVQQGVARSEPGEQNGALGGLKMSRCFKMF